MARCLANYYSIFTFFDTLRRKITSRHLFKLTTEPSMIRNPKRFWKKLNPENGNTSQNELFSSSKMTRQI